MVDAAALLLVATAFVLGIGHSLDPDHVVAVSTILCKCPSLRKSIASATAWGAGHSAAILLVGLLVLALRISIPTSILQLFEAAAGAMLIVLGALLLKPIIAQRIHMHKHKLSPSITLHIYSHSHSHGHTHLISRHSHEHEHSNTHVHKSVFTGVLQGMAGSAAVMLVTLTTVSSVELGLIFIALFGVGVILGMICISCIISSVIKYTTSRLEGVHEKINILTGSISIGFGFFLITQMALQLHI
jgi:ABC-type nickel/cobalt efflux system permease component RcnA